MVGFEDLPDDVVLCLFELLKDEQIGHAPYPGHRALIALSQVSRRIRGISLPAAYVDVKWRWEPESKFLPTHLLGYVKTLALVNTTMRIDHATLEFIPGSFNLLGMRAHLNAVLPTLVRLHTIKVEHSVSPLELWLRTYSLAPKLENLWFLESLWHPNIQPVPQLDDPVPIPKLRLKQLRHRVGLYRYDHLRAVEELELEHSLLLPIMSSVYDSVMILEIPGDHVALLSNFTFPRLTELHVRGLLPHGSRQLDSSFSLMKLVQGSPNIRIIDFALAKLENDGGQVIKLLGPNFNAPSAWPNLTCLYLANPCVDDRIFSLLPSTLEELTLPPYPTPFPHQYNASLVQLLTASELCGVLCHLSLPNLKRLAIWYECDDHDERLLAHVVCAFPSLRTLVLVRKRSQAKHQEEYNPFPLLTEYLPFLRVLTRLFLDIDVPEDRQRGVRSPKGYSVAGVTLLPHTDLTSLSQNIKNLEVLSVLATDHAGCMRRDWPYHVKRDAKGHVELILAPGGFHHIHPFWSA